MSSLHNKSELEHLFEDDTEDFETFKCANHIFSPDDYYTQHNSDQRYSICLSDLPPCLVKVWLHAAATSGLLVAPFRIPIRQLIHLTTSRTVVVLHNNFSSHNFL